MDKIIFGFSKPKSFKILSWLIMKIDGVPYSHAYSKIWSEKYQRHLIYQASGLLVNFCNQDIFESHNQTVAEFDVDISSDIKTKTMQYAIDHCGKPYSIKELVGFCWVKICLLVGKKVSNPFSDGQQSFVCSELVADLIKECLGQDLPKSPDDMTPRDLYDLLNSKFHKE